MSASRAKRISLTMFIVSRKDSSRNTLLINFSLANMSKKQIKYLYLEKNFFVFV